ncbi:MAG: hypothetical protein Phyf2KO_16280 [Phycisphaerales bacterium]
MRARFAAVLPVALLALAGCQCDACSTGGDSEADAQAAGFVNATCPVGGEAIAVDAGSADYNGNKVGFCCPGCKGGWNEMSDADKDQFIADAKAGTR